MKDLKQHDPVPHWTPGTDGAEYNAHTRTVGTMRATINAQEQAIKKRDLEIADLQKEIRRLLEAANFTNEREW